MLARFKQDKLAKLIFSNRSTIGGTIRFQIQLPLVMIKMGGTKRTSLFTWTGSEVPALPVVSFAGVRRKPVNLAQPVSSLRQRPRGAPDL
jgi:hypothetical protein